MTPTHRSLARPAAVAFGIFIVVATLAVAGPVRAAAGASGTTRDIPSSGTASFAVADTGASGTSGPETVGSSDGGANLTDRSNSSVPSTPVGATAQPRPVTTSTPGLQTSFDGLSHFDQRFGSSAGVNQFSLEPPDQGLCVGSDGRGNTRVVEVINDVLQAYTPSGTPLLAKPTALNQFLGYAPAIVRSTVTFGPEVTDPSCLYDAATGRWFIDALTLDTFPQPGSDGLEHFTGTNHVDLAVSNTSDPLGSWTIFRIATQDDGTDGTPNHHCAPNTGTATPLPTNPNACLADYPHMGSDANGVYLTTNEYAFFPATNPFHGAQVYALSKTQLETSATVAVTQFDTHGLDTFGFALNGFTLWPSTTPGGGGDPASGGTEYFLSSNAAQEAHDTGAGSNTPAHPSTQLLTWALTNTSSLNGTPALTLSNAKLDVGLYAPPPASVQKSGPQPLRDCLNNNPCSVALEGIKDPFTEKSSDIASNDSRMQQVTWVNGKLWGALDTGLSMSSGNVAGIEWFETAPSTSTGSVTTSLANSGYLGLGNDNLTYPAIGLTAGGTGVMAFTVLGSDFYPSAGYATVTSAGVGDVHLAASGAGPDDGFTDYKLFANNPNMLTPRWGDYGAAVPWGSNVWIASEYIGQTCSFATWQKTAFRCDNTRTALANWDTRISLVTAP